MTVMRCEVILHFRAVRAREAGLTGQPKKAGHTDVKGEDFCRLLCYNRGSWAGRESR